MGIDAPHINTTSSRGIFSFVRNIKPPALGELREPITIYKSSRKPVINPDGSNTWMFEEDITPIANVWCKIYQYQGGLLNGQNTQSSLSHVFVLRRDDTWDISIDSYVFWNGKVFCVRGYRSIDNGTKPSPEGVKFNCILADEWEPYAQEPKVVEPSEAANTGDTGLSTPDGTNPLWV